MTFGEAQRIARALGLPIDEAAEFAEVDGRGLVRLSGQAGPEVASLVASGTAIYLPQLPNGDCMYLGSEGCTIPTVKPHICAMFPFSKHNGRWTVGHLVGAPGFCFGQDQSQGFQAALTTFGMTVADLDRIERWWKRDRRSHGTQLRNWKSQNQ